VSIGLKGGSTISQIRFYPSIDEAFFSGYTGGVVFKMMSGKHVGIQTELNYTQKGWKEITMEDVEYSRRLNYLDIPFMTRISIGKKRFGVFFNIGPSLSFLLSENESVSANTVIEYLEGEDKYYGQPIDSKIDFQFTAGIGARLKMKSGNALELETRVYGSLPNIFESKKYIYTSSQNQLSTITIAYLFSLD
jgi:hypothetical protein